MENVLELLLKVENILGGKELELENKSQLKEVTELREQVRQASNKTYVMMSKQKTVTEWCPCCETEVELPAVFKEHTCPSCNVKIFPCNQCENQNCLNCPLEK